MLELAVFMLETLTSTIKKLNRTYGFNVWQLNLLLLRASKQPLTDNFT